MALTTTAFRIMKDICSFVMNLSSQIKNKCKSNLYEIQICYQKSIQDTKTTKYQLIRKTESKNQIKCVYEILKNKSPNWKLKQNKKLLWKKNLVWRTSPETHQRRLCYSWQYFICYLICWKEFRQLTAIHTLSLFTMCCCDGRQIQDTKV